jgi:hypothetical protein
MRHRHPASRLASLAIALGVLLAALGTPAAVAASTSVRYVSTGGSDGNPGTMAAPWRTVRASLMKLRPGMTLYIRGGTYAEDMDLDLPDGTATSRIVAGSYPGERAVITGLVRFRDADYWTFRGLNVTWRHGTYRDHMVKLIGGTGWIYEQSEIWGARSFANLLVTGNPRSWTIRRNVIHDVHGGESNIYRSHNIYANTGVLATGGLIERNVLYNAPRGANLKLGFGSGTNLATGAANVTVRYNTLYSAVQPLVLSGPTLKNIRVYRNLIVRGTRPSGGTYLVRLFEIRSGAGIVVENNLGFQAGRWCNDYVGGWSCSRVSGAGNIFPRDPRWSVTGAGRFKPTDSVAARYGRFAP